MQKDITINDKAMLDVENSDESKKEANSILSWIIFLAILACIIVFFKYVIGFTVITGDSMNPTLEDGDLILTSNLVYTIERNDIVIYRDDAGFNVIKRVIGLPGDKIAIQDGVVLVNGEALDVSFATGLSNEMSEVVVPQNAYFVLGDNRTPGESLDSRSNNVGAIDESKISGEAIFSVLPIGGL